MKLKPYQEETLNVLSAFFNGVQERRELEETFNKAAALRDRGRYATPYRRHESIEHVPYVCIRIPTGGGKTLLAAHTVRRASKDLLGCDTAAALWFVPTQTIRTQTVEALKNPRHPYRQVLDDAFSGRVRVFDIEEFEQIRADDLRDNTCVIVATIQSLKTRDKEAEGDEQHRLRVYRHREQLAPIFAGLTPAEAVGLDKLEDGRPRASFVNLMKLMRPLMIVDEAHKAVSDLTRDLQEDISPAAIVEFTATPEEENNILVSVTAGELKAEHIIKLPVVLSAHKTWQDAVASAVAERNRLADLAKNEGDYLRPMVLFQAQRKDQEVTVEVLKKHLTDTEQIPADKIAVVTGDQRELDGINPMDRNCPIDYVITIEALKEGWDCSFAYVFCSVANIRSAISIEQLLGRVMRMPYAEKRSHADLNCAYAHVVDHDGWAAVGNLRDRMVKGMGFEEAEADHAVRVMPLPLPGGGTPEPEPVRIELNEGVTAEALPETVRSHASIERAPDTGRVTVVFRKPIESETAEELVKLVAPERKAEARLKIELHRKVAERMRSPAEQGKSFQIPLLYAHVQGELFLADAEAFLTSDVWNLADENRFPATLTDQEFDLKREGVTVNLDVAQQGGREVLRIENAMARSAYAELGGGSFWDARSLAAWLAREVRDDYLSPVVVRRFCLGIIEDQLEKKRPIAELAVLKFRLARAISAKINVYRKTALKAGYQKALFEPGAKVEVRFDEAFAFPVAYPLIQPYRGSFRFQKHFYGPDHISKLESKGEEFECARELDGLDPIEYWVRNLDSQPEYSFRLPLAGGWFYPDFVAKLKDGRSLVVEYKGAMMSEEEKRMVGELWMKHSQGKGVFVWARKQDEQSRNVQQQLLGAVTRTR